MNTKDFRSIFLQDVEQSLIGIVDTDVLNCVVNNITMILNNYEIVERCTELVPADNENEKILKQYLACLAVEGKSENTILQYGRALKKMSNEINKSYVEYGVYDIRYYFAREKQRGISSVSLENTRSYISAFFKWLSREGIITRNIMESIHPIKVPKEVKEPFSDIEIDMLRSACKNLKERALIETLLSTGVRVDELSKMNISDIDFSTMTVHVLHGKGSKERTTYINNIGRKHLMAYLESREDDTLPLFVNYRKTRLNNGGIRNILNKIGARAGVENVHPHRFRRTFATGLAARGMDIQEIQRLLGHSNVNTTMRYIKINDSQVQASYRRYIA